MFGAFDYKANRPLGPDDLSILHAVLVEYCRARQCDRGGAQALAAARELLCLYDAGIAERDALLERLNSEFPL
ncbi:hypothetical protein HGP14_26725 [Rhizobium sp. P32RR-XVIII]|uniref:hypothetical protein n=1 Tax=Rhizobium sp. P32RR-XVIII TaxID=2726738 RepID=UPI0014575E78|nr:hypothetical protein [Rhizobium sp. P32RR-XVIII]NLS06902.1 hypothetical protein [Rhizobium sp. P32RR-XVIII]